MDSQTDIYQPPGSNNKHHHTVRALSLISSERSNWQDKDTGRGKRKRRYQSTSVHQSSPI